MKKNVNIYNETFLKPQKIASPLALRFMISRFHGTKQHPNDVKRRWVEGIQDVPRKASKLSKLRYRRPVKIRAWDYLRGILPQPPTYMKSSLIQPLTAVKIMFQSTDRNPSHTVETFLATVLKTADCQGSLHVEKNDQHCRAFTACL